MANRPISQTLPANLPTNWVQNQIVPPNGSDVGQSTEYGYNYLNRQINDAQNAVNTINAAFDGLVGTSVPTPAYGVCSTAAATSAKAVTVTGAASTFALYTGVSVRIIFANENTASNPTLNVNNTGAIAIQKLSGTAAETGAWQAGECRDFVYSGTAWVMVDGTLDVNCAKTQTGTYTGTGTRGQSNPNSLTFNFTPEFVLVFSTKAFVAYGSYMAVTFLVYCWGNTEAGFTPVGYDSPTNIYASTSNNTMQWYINDGGEASIGALRQMNSSGIEYGYIAIG